MSDKPDTLPKVGDEVAILFREKYPPYAGVQRVEKATVTKARYYGKSFVMEADGHKFRVARTHTGTWVGRCDSYQHDLEAVAWIEDEHVDYAKAQADRAELGDKIRRVHYGAPSSWTIVQIRALLAAWPTTP